MYLPGTRLARHFELARGRRPLEKRVCA